MLTLEGLISVISLCVTIFSLAYMLGRNSKKNNRPSPTNLTVIINYNMD